MVGTAKKTDPDTLHEDALLRRRKVKAKIAETKSAQDIVKAERAQIGAKLDQMDAATAKRHAKLVSEDATLTATLEDLGHALADAEREVGAADAYRRRIEADRMRDTRNKSLGKLQSDMEELDRVWTYAATLAQRIEQAGNAVASMTRYNGHSDYLQGGGKGLLEASARALLNSGWHPFLSDIPGKRSYKSDQLTLSDRAAAMASEVVNSPVVLD